MVEEGIVEVRVKNRESVLYIVCCLFEQELDGRAIWWFGWKHAGLIMRNCSIDRLLGNYCVDCCRTRIGWRLGNRVSFGYCGDGLRLAGRDSAGKVNLILALLRIEVCSQFRMFQSISIAAWYCSLTFISFYTFFRNCALASSSSLRYLIKQVRYFSPLKWGFSQFRELNCLFTASQISQIFSLLQSPASFSLLETEFKLSLIRCSKRVSTFSMMFFFASVSFPIISFDRFSLLETNSSCINASVPNVICDYRTPGIVFLWTLRPCERSPQSPRIGAYWTSKYETECAQRCRSGRVEADTILNVRKTTLRAEIGDGFGGVVCAVDLSKIHQQYKVMFENNQVVWARVSGFPLWPATIIKMYKPAGGEEVYYSVSFCGESATATISQCDISQFDTSRPEFTPHEKLLKRHPNLRRALDEAANKLQKSKPKIKDPLQTKDKPLQRAESDYRKSRSFRKKKEKKASGESEDSIIVSASDDERNIPHSQQKLVNESVAEEDEMKEEFSPPNRIIRNNFERSPKQMSKSDQSPSNRGPAMLSQSVEDLSQSASKKSSNPIRFTPSQGPINKKEVLLQKRKEKEDCRIQSLNKILSSYITHLPCTENSPEQKSVREIQFKLQCIVFLILDSSSTDEPLKIKLKQLRTVFDIAKIDAKMLMESKISALLSFILEQLSRKFQEEREWIQKTIDLLNQKILQSMNNCQFYTDVLNATRSFISCKQFESSP